MILTWLHQLTRRKASSSRRSRSRARRPLFRPQLESLETRLAPATRVWDGGSVINDNWMTDRNWEGNNAPVAGDDLVFPAGVSSNDKTTTNNFPVGTRFRSITIEDSGYTLNGNRLQLFDGSALTTADGIFATFSGGAATINLPIELPNASFGGFGSFPVSPEIAFGMVSGATVTVNGVISGGSPASGFFGSAFTTLAKVGPGTLILNGSNTHDAVTRVEVGVLRVTNNSALGPSGSATNVHSGAALQLDDVVITNELITLSGTGIGLTGALRSIGGVNFIEAASSTSSPVQSLGDSSIGVNTGTTLRIENLSGPVDASGNPVPVNLTKSGGGGLVLAGSNTSSIITYDVFGPLEFDQANYPNGTVTVRNGGTLTGTGTAPGVSVQDGGTLNPGSTLFGVPVGQLTLNGNTLLGAGLTGTGSILDLRITNVGNPFDRIAVNGTVSISPGSRLNLNSGATVQFQSAMNTFVIVENDGADAIQGLFKNAVDGSDLPDNSLFQDIHGRAWRIQYDGGTGNDVTVTYAGPFLATPPQFQNRHVTSPIIEGSVATLTGTIIEPDPNDTFFLDVTWGDGTATETFVFPPGSNGQIVSVTHRYRDNAPGGGDYQIHLSWRDQTGLGNSAVLPVTVRNAPPAVAAGPDLIRFAGQQLNRRGAFADPGRDSWAATIDYGDGSGSQLLDLNGQRFQLRHRYAQPGVYTVTVTVTDDDGGVGRDSFTVVVLPRSGRAAFIQPQTVLEKGLLEDLAARARGWSHAGEAPR